jgi:hypothetical protein
VVSVTDSATGGVLYVAATGPPYPIEISMGGADAGTLSFDKWNQPVSVLRRRTRSTSPSFRE